MSSQQVNNFRRSMDPLLWDADFLKYSLFEAYTHPSPIKEKCPTTILRKEIRYKIALKP